MKTLGYYNGTYDELDRMMVPMNDRVCYFGDGVYDAGPCRNYHIFAIDEHIDRFFNNHSNQILRGSYHNNPIQRHGLEYCQRHFPCSRRHIHKHHVDVTP